MRRAILTLNIGSSSVKASLRDADTKDAEPEWTSRINAKGETAPVIASLIKDARQEAPGFEIVAVGHRIVHAGPKYAAATIIDDAVLEYLATLNPLAPKHQVHNLKGVEQARTTLPEALQVACFDTAYHQTMTYIERLFALPREYAKEGVLRYGFHGLSYAHIAGVLPEIIGDAADGRVIVAHLGAGASLCAMRARRSVATTMGFTALDGLPMATRSGSIDPGLLLYLLQDRGMCAGDVEDLLYNKSGLLGVSGLSGDMRALLASREPHARQAVDLFCYRVSREIGSLAAVLSGLDVLIFTGGVGENAAPVRAEICRQAGWLGVELDAVANEAGASRISVTGSRASAWTIPTDEEREIARETRALLAAA